MSLREKWEFEYTASKLADAAMAKRDSHQKRLQWWQQKKAEVMQRVKDEGIEVRDSVASYLSNTKGAFGPQIEIDAGLQRDLTECQMKLQEHNASVQSYDGWLQVLQGNAEARLRLNHDDWLFFFGA